MGGASGSGPWALRAVTFGLLGSLAPDTFAAMYGVQPTPATRAMTRLWGTHTLALGVLGFLAEPSPARRTMVQVTLAMNVADALGAAATSGLPAKARAGGPLTSLGFAALAAYVLSED